MYPRVNVYNGESPFSMSKSTVSMAMFTSAVERVISPSFSHSCRGQILRLHLPGRAADPHRCGTERLRQGPEAERRDVVVIIRF